MEKSINDFIKDLQKINPELRKKPLVIRCPNDLLVYPNIKMIFKDNDFLNGKVEQMVITWQD